MKKFLVFIIIILLLYISRADLLAAYARLFTVNTATEGADAMIIMSGNIDTRPAHAAKLYHEGYAKRVFLTVEKNWHDQLTPYVEARNTYARRFLLDSSVPVEWLPSTHEEGAMSSMDEALDVADFLKNNPDIRHLIIVTDAPHTYRTLYAFNKVFEANGLGHIQLEMAAAPNDVFDESNWYTTEKGLIFYFEEPIKVLFYWVNMANSSLVVPR
jgi:uncharacterized SAM-binding protein YcdF (DUF218 family)